MVIEIEPKQALEAAGHIVIDWQARDQAEGARIIVYARNNRILASPESRPLVHTPACTQSLGLSHSHSSHTSHTSLCQPTKYAAIPLASLQHCTRTCSATACLVLAASIYWIISQTNNTISKHVQLSRPFL